MRTEQKLNAKVRSKRASLLARLTFTGRERDRLSSLNGFSDHSGIWIRRAPDFLTETIARFPVARRFHRPMELNHPEE